MKSFQGIGIMTGTSMDGVDLACCNFTESEGQYSFSLEACTHVPFDEKWRSRLFKLRDQSAEIYAKTHVYFGHLLGRITRDFIKEHGLKPHFVASHGQTIFHQPDRNFTAQIGDGETLVSYLSCPLVSNFRNKNVALGGEGAPLIVMGERLLFQQHKLFLNLGGFSNLSYGELAFDVSPCNIVLNELVQMLDPSLEYDDKGTIAAKGNLIPSLLDRLNAHAYFAKSGPRSLGWEWVASEVFPVLNEYLSEAAPIDSLLHTYCKHIAEQVRRAAVQVAASNESLLITGGGRHNEFLYALIKEAVSPHGIYVADASTKIIDFKEAIVFAFLGLRLLAGKPNTVAAATGSPQDEMCGSIHVPPHRPYPFTL